MVKIKYGERLIWSIILFASLLLALLVITPPKASATQNDSDFCEGIPEVLEYEHTKTTPGQEGVKEYRWEAVFKKGKELKGWYVTLPNTWKQGEKNTWYELPESKQPERFDGIAPTGTVPLSVYGGPSGVTVSYRYGVTYTMYHPGPDGTSWTTESSPPAAPSGSTWGAAKEQWKTQPTEPTVETKWTENASEDGWESTGLSRVKTEAVPPKWQTDDPNGSCYNGPDRPEPYVETIPNEFMECDGLWTEEGTLEHTFEWHEGSWIDVPGDLVWGDPVFVRDLTENELYTLGCDVPITPREGPDLNVWPEECYLYGGISIDISEDYYPESTTSEWSTEFEGQTLLILSVGTHEVVLTPSEDVVFKNGNGWTLNEDGTLSRFVTIDWEGAVDCDDDLVVIDEPEAEPEEKPKSDIGTPISYEKPSTGHLAATGTATNVILIWIGVAALIGGLWILIGRRLKR